MNEKTWKGFKDIGSLATICSGMYKDDKYVPFTKKERSICCREFILKKFNDCKSHCNNKNRCESICNNTKSFGSILCDLDTPITKDSAVYSALNKINCSKFLIELDKTKSPYEKLESEQFICPDGDCTSCLKKNKDSFIKKCIEQCKGKNCIKYCQLSYNNILNNYYRDNEIGESSIGESSIDSGRVKEAKLKQIKTVNKQYKIIGIIIITTVSIIFLIVLILYIIYRQK